MARLTRSQITGGGVPGLSGVVLLARLRGHDGQLVTRASLSSITWTVSNLATGTSLGSGSFAVASCVYDDLRQDDPRWSADSAIHPGADGAWGYNFAGELAAALFPATALAAPGVLSGPAAPQRLQADVAFTPVTGQPLRVVWSWQQLPVYG